VPSIKPVGLGRRQLQGFVEGFQKRRRSRELVGHGEGRGGSDAKPQAGEGPHGGFQGFQRGLVSDLYLAFLSEAKAAPMPRGTLNLAGRRGNAQG